MYVYTDIGNYMYYVAFTFFEYKLFEKKYGCIAICFFKLKWRTIIKSTYCKTFHLYAQLLR